VSRALVAPREHHGGHISRSRACEANTGPADSSRQRIDVTATCDVPKTFHDEGACLGSDSAHAATIVASSSRRVHMFASSKKSSFQPTAPARPVLPVPLWRERRSGPVAPVGRDAYCVPDEEPEEPEEPLDEPSPPGELLSMELAFAAPVFDTFAPGAVMVSLFFATCFAFFAFVACFAPVFIGATLLSFSVLSVGATATWFG